jgi:hypothetical protein
MSLPQHFIGFADTGCCAYEDPELADTPFLAARRFKERFR